MTTEQTTSTAQPAPDGPGRVQSSMRAAAGPARLGVVASALALGAATVAAVLVWRPWGERDAFGYADIEPLRDNVWIGTLLDGLGFAVAAIAFGLLVCHLVRNRGRRWATTGAVVTGLAGITYAMGSMAHGAVGWVATSDAVSVDAGTALLKFVEDDGVRIIVPAMVGFLGYTIGTLVLSIALLRGGAVSRWLPISFIVLTLAQFGPLPGRVLDFVQVALMALLVCLAGIVFARRTQ